MRSQAGFHRAKGHSKGGAQSSAQARPAKVRSHVPDRLGRWRALTIALLVTGYAGYYLCRSDLSVAMPLLIAEMGQERNRAGRRQNPPGYDCLARRSGLRDW